MLDSISGSLHECKWILPQDSCTNKSRFFPWIPTTNKNDLSTLTGLDTTSESKYEHEWIWPQSLTMNNIGFFCEFYTWIKVDPQNPTTKRIGSSFSHRWVVPFQNMSTNRSGFFLEIPSWTVIIWKMGVLKHRQGGARQLQWVLWRIFEDLWLWY